MIKKDTVDGPDTDFISISPNDQTINKKGEKTPKKGEEPHVIQDIQSQIKQSKVPLLGELNTIAEESPNKMLDHDSDTSSMMSNLIEIKHQNDPTYPSGLPLTSPKNKQPKDNTPVTGDSGNTSSLSIIEVRPAQELIDQERRAPIENSIVLDQSQNNQMLGVEGQQNNNNLNTENNLGNDSWFSGVNSPSRFDASFEFIEGPLKKSNSVYKKQVMQKKKNMTMQRLDNLNSPKISHTKRKGDNKANSHDKRGGANTISSSSDQKESQHSKSDKQEKMKKQGNEQEGEKQGETTPEDGLSSSQLSRLRNMAEVLENQFLTGGGNDLADLLMGTGNQGNLKTNVPKKNQPVIVVQELGEQLSIESKNLELNDEANKLENQKILDELEALKQKNMKLEEDLKLIRSKNEENISKKTEFEKKLSIKDTQHQKSLSTISDLKEQIKMLRKSQMSIHEEITKSNDIESEKLKSTITSLKKEINEAKASQKGLISKSKDKFQSQITDLTKQLKDKNRECNKLKTQLASSTEEFMGDLTRMNSEMGKLKLEREEHKATAVDCKKKTESYRVALQKSQNELQKVQGQVKSASESNQLLNEKAVKVSQERDNLQKMKSKLEGELKEAKRKERAAISEQEVSSVESKNFGDRIKMLQRRYEKVMQDCDQEKSTRIKLEKQTKNQKLKIQELESRTVQQKTDKETENKLKEQLEDLKAKLQESMENEETSREGLEDLQEMIEGHQEEKDELEGQSLRMGAEIEALQEEVEDLKKNMAQQDSGQLQTNEMVEKKDKEIGVLQKEVEESKKDKDSFRKETEALIARIKSEAVDTEALVRIFLSTTIFISVVVEDVVFYHIS